MIDSQWRLSVTKPVDHLDSNTTVPVGRFHDKCLVLSGHHSLQLLPVLGQHEGPAVEVKVSAAPALPHLGVAPPQTVLPSDGEQAGELVDLHRAPQLLETDLVLLLLCDW